MSNFIKSNVYGVIMTRQGFLHELTHLILTKVLWDPNKVYPHFRDEDIKAPATH